MVRSNTHLPFTFILPPSAILMSNFIFSNLGRFDSGILSKTLEATKVMVAPLSITKLIPQLLTQPFINKPFGYVLSFAGKSSDLTLGLSSSEAKLWPSNLALEGFPAAYLHPLNHFHYKTVFSQNTDCENDPLHHSSSNQFPLTSSFETFP